MHCWYKSINKKQHLVGGDLIRYSLIYAYNWWGEGAPIVGEVPSSALLFDHPSCKYAFHRRHWQIHQYLSVCRIHHRTQPQLRNTRTLSLSLSPVSQQGELISLPRTEAVSQLDKQAESSTCSLRSWNFFSAPCELVVDLKLRSHQAIPTAHEMGLDWWFKAKTNATPSKRKTTELNVKVYVA